MRVLGLVPARGGSSRVPRKNLARLGGKTLVRRALETALGAGCFEIVALSSDDDEILGEAEGLDVVERGLEADDVRGYEMPPERSFDIDTERDVAFAEFLLERGGLG